MRRFPVSVGLSITVFVLTAAGCTSGSGKQAPSSGGSAAGGASSGGTNAGGSGGAGGSASTIVSSGTGGAAGTTGVGGTPATTGGSSGGSGGTTGGGGTMANGGSSARGGSAGSSTGGIGAGGTAGSAATGGAGGAAGAATGGVRTGGTAGSASTGGVSSGGTAGAATGGARTGGASGSGGVVGTGGSTADAGPPSACGTGMTPAANPFGCKFGWGVNGNPQSYLQFASTWAGYNIQANGTFGSNGFDSASFLNRFASMTAVPAYYAYFIGYYGHVNGIQDGNVNPNGPNLTNAMGPMLLGVDNAACPSGTICDQNLIVKAYAWYAAQTYAVFKKPVIWLLEGDFIQYSVEGSTSGLSYAQLGQLATQITLAIKCNDPPAVVAINYSPWISSSQATSYFNGINAAMAAAGTTYDLVWTTGSGSSASFGNTTYTAVHGLSGRSILVDESFGLSAANDTWANQPAATIQARMAAGVTAANITTDAPSYLQTNVTTALAPSALGSTCP